MRVLVLGGAGLLGSALRATVPAAVHLDAPPRAMLDATDPDALDRALDAARPDWVISCVAYTAVDRAEAEPEAAARLNAEAPAVLGRLAATRGVRVLLPSTDYVFDGGGTRPWREDDPTGPRSVYGRTKRAGEEAMLTSGALATIVRTSWLFGGRARSFPRTMWERAVRRQPASVVEDQRGSPTYASDLARWCWALLPQAPTGILHAANAGTATWADVAERVYAAAGFAGGVTRVPSTAFPTPAPRPAYSVLDCSRLDALLPGARRRWEPALDEFVTLLREGDA
jgi:dTDP-4-dehydrorhamnose reductase